MIIDFHTHCFPEQIAEKTIALLAERASLKPATDGTLSGLRQSMKESGISYSVVLPVVTKPSQFERVNQYAASINGTDGIFSFGGIHPDAADYMAELDTIKKLGLKGIKIHPDYQQCSIDDPRYIAIIRYALSLDLLVVTHAGIDVGISGPPYSAPEAAARMLQKVYGEIVPEKPQIIFAHTGGWQCWDDVENNLVGKLAYFDISFSLPMIPDEQLLRIIRNHGAERILFATDSPWGGQKETLERFLALPLTKEEQHLILSGNGAKLLSLPNL